MRYLVVSVTALAAVTMVTASSAHVQDGLVIPIAQKTVNKLPGNSGHTLVPGRRPSAASVTLECGNVAYVLNSGPGGHCNQNGTHATCNSGHGNTASASCSKGCKKTKGNGACAIFAH